MEYNKERDTRDKSRAFKSGSGPRDLQRKQKEVQNSYAVNELKEQINLLTKQISVAGPPVAKYTAEDFDDELNKVILQVSSEMENKYSARIKEQQEEILKLRRQLDTGIKPGIKESDINLIVNKAVEEAKSENQAQLFLLQESVAKLTRELHLAEDKVIELKKQVNLYEPKALEADKLRSTLEVTKSQLTSLKNNTASNSGDSSKLVADIDVLKVELAQLKTDLAVSNSKLESKDEIIKIKDDTISTLKSTPVNIQITDSQTTKTAIPESARPKMEQVFIDPSDTKKSMAPHLNFKDVKIAEQEKMSSKVAKLKDLLGSLPE
jgi:chromosome segregation ATPase